MTDLMPLMNGEQKAQYASGEIKRVVSAAGSIVATDSDRKGEGRTPRLAIEAMK